MSVTTALSGEEVWTAATKDKSFRAEAPNGSPVESVLRPFILNSPAILAELLDEPVTLRVLANAKIAFLRHLLANDFAEKMAPAIGQRSGTVQAALADVVGMFAEMVEDIPGTLETQGVTESQVMLGSNVGLNKTNKKLYRAGTLTVAEVLRTQPSVILKNSGD